MRVRGLLAAFLLGMSLCFVPVLGYGEVRHELYKAKASLLDLNLVWAMVDYVMRNPDTFEYVRIFYDPDGRFRDYFPEGIDTKGKIVVGIADSRGYFSDKSERDLLEAFKSTLEVVYRSIGGVATNMDTDIVAKFSSRDTLALGYFYQGEYHLWEK